jgi:hypothetical protein
MPENQLYDNAHLPENHRVAEYLTEAAYKRWYRQYQINIAYYVDILDGLRIRIDTLLYDEDIEEIHYLMNEIDEHLDQVVPRNFNPEGQPIQGLEKFSENIKVMVNLVRRILGKHDKFLGIYQQEKNRVLKVHQVYKFKDKLNELREKVAAAEARKKQEYYQHQGSVDPIAAGAE